MAISFARTSFGFKAGLILATAAVLALTPGTAQAQEDYTPGAPGVGDPYFPLDGNGGYDVITTGWRSPTIRGRTC